MVVTAADATAGSSLAKSNSEKGATKLVAPFCLRRLNLRIPGTWDQYSSTLLLSADPQIHRTLTHVSSKDVRHGLERRILQWDPSE